MSRFRRCTASDAFVRPPGLYARSVFGLQGETVTATSPPCRPWKWWNPAWASSMRKNSEISAPASSSSLVHSGSNQRIDEAWWVLLLLRLLQRRTQRRRHSREEPSTRLQKGSSSFDGSLVTCWLPNRNCSKGSVLSLPPLACLGQRILFREKRLARAGSRAGRVWSERNEQGS